VLSLEQSIADGEGKVLDLDTASLRAKQDINTADQDATTLSNDRDSDIAETQQQVEADLASMNLKIALHRDLMAGALIGAPEAAARTAQSGQVPLTYITVRTVDGKTSEIADDETTPVKPGDVIKVALAGLPTN
jgi:exopolysaccharide production protein ExoF